jgi:prolyl 4-hydroxylase
MSEENYTSTRQFGADLWNMIESGPSGGFRRTTSAPQLYNQVGSLLTAWTEIRNNDHIYVVPLGTWFIWPAVQVGHKVTLPAYVEAPGRQPVQIETISLYPRAFRIKGLVSKEEAEAVIAYNTPKLERSKIYDHLGGSPKPEVVGAPSSSLSDEERDRGIAVTNIRTSYNSFDSHSPAADAIIQRCYNLLRIPYNNVTADGLQLVRYSQKQAYDIHTDYFPISYKPPNNFDPTRGGSNRFATVFMYLTTVEQGGETVFPHGQKLPGWEDESSFMDPGDVFPEDSWEHAMVKLCRTSLATKPIQGEAVLFYSQTPTGVLDPYSEHGGCPVLKGDKWGANLWVWNGARLAMKSAYTVTFHNKLQAQVGLYYFLIERKLDGPEMGERTMEYLDTIDPGASRSFKCFSEDVFMAKTIATDAIINLYEILDAPAKGLTISFDIDNLSETDSIKRARTYEFMKGFELGYRGGHAKGLEDGMSPSVSDVENAEGRTVMSTGKTEL